MPVSEEKIQEYIQQLSEKETQALKIAEEHLGSSFNIVKSIGFIKWMKKNSQ
jgi:hypothetical protein|tara:strand:+ start:5449 stop:5604 length:156 start_codon:yes stop_codon:yes gene_type:complete